MKSYWYQDESGRFKRVLPKHLHGITPLTARRFMYREKLWAGYSKTRSEMRIWKFPRNGKFR